jgi:NitT/TauT family transport system ATP-binding protein
VQSTTQVTHAGVETPARGGVKIDRVRKVYETRGEPILALDECSLDLQPGEFVSVVGPSGCGKSTLMLILAGLLPATSGTITIGDTVVKGPYTDLGIVFQEPVLLEWRKVLGNILLQVELRRGVSKRRYIDRARELLELVGLEGFENRYPFELSGGMRQRVSICRALLHDPPLLLMDEPFGALDALTRDQLNLDLQSIWMGSGKTVMFVTHSISEAVFLSDRVVVFSGRPAMVTADFIRPGAVVVDVGINKITSRAEAEKIFEPSRLAVFDKAGSLLVGDVHPGDMARVSSAYTPVPGGVGPLTIAMLMSNTIDSAERRTGISQ